MEQLSVFVEKVLEADQEMSSSAGLSRNSGNGFQVVKKRNEMVDIGQRIWNLCVKRKKMQVKQIVPDFFAQRKKSVFPPLLFLHERCSHSPSVSQCSCDLLIRGWTEDTITRNCELLKCFCATAKAWSDTEIQENFTRVEICFKQADHLAEKVMNSVNNNEIESEGEQFRVKKTVLSVSSILRLKSATGTSRNNPY